jgi:hypothetical protein
MEAQKKGDDARGLEHPNTRSEGRLHEAIVERPARQRTWIPVRGRGVRSALRDRSDDDGNQQVSAALGDEQGQRLASLMGRTQGDISGQVIEVMPRISQE